MNESTNQQKSESALREERMLDFWRDNDIFKKTLEKPATKGEFVFFEGPPTANAKPALHHLLARAFKDVIPRYKTMQGFHVPRRAGWDTHGLPVELQIEKKLELASKKDIEAYGIEKFNKECKDSVFTYIKDWEDFTDRIGYWVDKDKAYYTFNTRYMESLWNIVGKVNEQGLLYKDYKIIPWCARCGTGLSSHELAQEYHLDKDLSVYAKFPIVGFDKAYFVAWTTTPWTLPGNVALAVGADIDYVEAKVGDEILLIAKECLSLLPEGYEIVAEHKGSEMAGMQYEPLYPYLAAQIAGTEKEKLAQAYKVYVADFVTTTDGTGIVHIAPMYGADDFALGTAVGLPKFHTVNVEGKFIAGTDFLEGRFVKDEEVAVDIIKDLAHRGLLFKKEKYEHSYPHCWRCKTALIYYARDSWYIAMSKLRDTLVAENKSINWEPSHIKEGRFGEWLDGIKDWAISRERYWGTPLPIWISEDSDRMVVDSIDMLKKYVKHNGNNYFVMRHGETEFNVAGNWNVNTATTNPLTTRGKEQAIQSATALADKQIDLIIASPFARTQETARIVAEKLGLAAEAIVTDARLGEWNVGSAFEGKPIESYFEMRNKAADRYGFKTVDGESYADVIKRAGEALYDIESRYQGKNILIVAHGASTRALELVARGISFDRLFEETRDYVNFSNAEVRPLHFVPLPHNAQFELDLHRPFIDDVVLVKDGKEYRRTKEVMDVWFDSGAMPFAQDHYPFDGEIAYPADFISEAIDQTRGWFYTLHAIGLLTGRGKAYKNVICLGHLLDAQGKKMSKSIGNIVNPWEQMEKYGVDTLRLWMYSVNQPGDSKNYDEKTVVELHRQIFGLLYNVLSFYELYRDPKAEEVVPNSEHILDAWILTRLDQLTSVMTGNMDQYKVLEPVRALRDFIDDLSTWYLRRSRDRIKDGDVSAKATLYRVLKTVAQLMAPFAPFAAEDIWQKLKTGGALIDAAPHDPAGSNAESVHLSTWPAVMPVSDELLKDMATVREVCTQGNALRKKEGIAVRQPLQALYVKNWNLSDQYAAIVMQELNVKSVIAGEETKLDTTITLQLKLEGEYRELVRTVQDMRKDKGLAPSDIITLTLPFQYQSVVDSFGEELKKTVGATSVAIGGEAITLS